MQSAQKIQNQMHSRQHTASIKPLKIEKKKTVFVQPYTCAGHNEYFEMRKKIIEQKIINFTLSDHKQKSSPNENWLLLPQQHGIRLTTKMY